ncbi:hypothetical protein GCM10011351_20100 [Paraliobacillus quinghaiensis]|uniref:Uncharacterized protein n=1 Tax=Paraliobacillus quinghaiensis TaxID=470815 RepID=A0A917WUQ6_9BACI|nr:hypothetical protein [Paraliobacillus quinghaiensis]GGM34112.1 hypothetical protein GCM10011351_20100 [Paraliobacillus quinghaiensis]
MDSKEYEKYIIENYQAQEKGMILLFAQWCINNNLEPKVLYKEAYPNQDENKVLEEVMELTVSKKEADEIDHYLLLDALQAYGNDDLAFIVAQYVEKMD